MTDTSFRKINIDVFDEEVLLETELYDVDSRDPSTVLSDAKQKSSQVRGALSKGDIAGALSIVLDQPAYGTGVEEAKALTLSSVLLILNSTKTTDIPGIIRSLSQDEQDNLMKYLYKGMSLQGENPKDVNGSVMLGWHERLTEVAGIGCIVRVMTDPRTL